MYRILIVDDEEYIANSIYYFFKEQEHLELDVYKCYNVNDAIKLLGRIRFNVVITDINMPERNGMELISEVKRLWEDCRMVILTGYSQFEYAYQALQYSNVTYLLKTEGYDKLFSLVENYLKDIEREAAKENVLTQLKSRVDFLMLTLQHELVGRLLYRRLKKVTQKELDSVGCGMQLQRPVALLLARIDRCDTDVFPYDFEWISQVLILEVDRHTAKRGILKMQAVGDGEITFIFQDGDSRENGSKPGMLIYLQEMLPAIQCVCIQTGITLSFSLSREIAQWEDIPQEYILMKRIMNTSVGLNQGVIIAGYDEPPAKDESILYTGVNDMQRLSSYLQAGKKDSFLEEFDSLTAALRNNVGMDDPAARQCYMACAFVIVDYINQYCGKFNFKHDPSVLLYPEKLDSWAQGLDMLSFMYFEVLDFMEQSRIKNTNWVVERVKEYIGANYMNDLSLVSIADTVHFNPSYLSRLYKEVTGSNIQDYIKEIRIEHVQKLLKNENLRITDIAVKTGFGSSKYLISVFRKSTGFTPAEWREKQALSQYPKILS